MKRKIINIWGIITFILAASIFVYTQEKPKAELVDSFNYSNAEVVSARIDNFFILLNASPQNAGLVIVYGGKIGKKGEVEAHLRGIKETFRLKGIDQKRVFLGKGGFREKLTVEFWVIPMRADKPKATPTIDAKKVKFKGVSPKIIRYECCF